MIDFGIEPIVIWKYGNTWIAKIQRLDDVIAKAKTPYKALQMLKKEYAKYNDLHAIDIP